jgi:hydroxymethylpyrimidine/phosphomethylpyrimidine kinase
MNTSRQTEKYRYHRVLSIAGSDSGGGAGIQADLKTFSANGCFGMTVITALTAQNTTGVGGIHAVPPSFAAEQLDAIYEDIGTDAVKIGMLYSAELIRVVAERLRKYGVDNIVLDPVMVAQSGDKLVEDDAVAAIKTHLMPLASVVTPNVPEAEVLCGHQPREPAEIEAAAKILAEYGSTSILIKGGHNEGSASSDLLYFPQEDRMIRLSAERINTRNNHGTGCTLSSAIAAFLAKGANIESAVRNAKDYITNAIRAGADYQLGQGHGPVHHFHEFWT